MNLVGKLFRLPSQIKLWLQLVWDLASIGCAFLLAYWVRLGMEAGFPGLNEWKLLASCAALLVGLLFFTGHYRQVLRYISPKAVAIVLLVDLFASVYLWVAAKAFDAFVPFSIPVIFWAISIALMMAPRALVFMLMQTQGHRQREKCLIFGAAESGRTLAVTLKQNSDLLPVAFIDDKRRYRGKQILGMTVYARDRIPQLVAKYGVSKMLLAVPNTSIVRRQELIRELEPYALELMTVPDLGDLASGKRQIDELREIRIEELLGREPVPPIRELLVPNLAGKRVMITGAGGSIGSELCRQIAKAQPASIVLFEISEFNLYQIEAELRRQHPELKIDAVLATIQDSEVIREVLTKYRVQTIYHAAAYKHVPMVECNVSMGIRNNIFGTANLALIAAEFEVEKFVLVSTDKAVRPTNVMGATKRFAELYIQGIAELETKTEYAIVRFGNVLGSSGSVVPLFTQQIRQGGPITVTHPDIIRYFMTIPEAAQLVIQAGTMGKSGEVFVLDMGEPVKIVDLATKMAHLMGFSIRGEDNPNGDIELKFSGLRPGEKLYEELLIDDADTDTAHPRIMGANEVKLPFHELVMLMDQLNHALIKRDEASARQMLIEAPLAYHPATH